jgi:hypothetical protein
MAENFGVRSSCEKLMKKKAFKVTFIDEITTVEE